MDVYVEKCVDDMFLHSNFDHPNVVKLYGITLHPLQMILEFVPGVALSSYLHNKSITDEQFSWKLRHEIALDIAKGLSFLHRLQPPVIHRDLRSPNIFVSFYCTKPLISQCC